MFYAISDLHLSTVVNKPMDIFGGNWEGYFEKIKTDWRARVKDDDVVLIAGDISWAMRLEDAVPDLEEIAALPGKKVIIKGNHE
jgi:predicted phosphohydrolase